MVFVNLKDTVGATEVQPLWYQVRKKMDDIKSTMPSGVQGPFYNDEFGDTYSLIYALTSDGLSHRELKDLASGLRADFLRVPDVAKVDLDRPAGREDLSGILDAEGRSPRPRRRLAVAGAAGAERADAERHGRCRPRAHRHPRHPASSPPKRA